MTKTNTRRRQDTNASDRAEAVVAWLRRRGSARARDGMARYGLPSERAFGVAMNVMQRYAKELGRDHELAMALWNSGWYEARTVAAFVDEPARVTPAQMDQWCGDFDSWGICDTVCFHLFDRTPHAWRKVAAWSRRRDEFGKRAAFALLACLALHDKSASDDKFLAALPLIERAASDDRNFVKKGVSWALRLIGRRSPVLNAAAVSTARRLADSDQPAARWVGKGAVKELTTASVVRRLTRSATPSPDQSARRAKRAPRSRAGSRRSSARARRHTKPDPTA
jgi:3-methyladenine DNA glycosylase AlkD